MKNTPLFFLIFFVFSIFYPSLVVSAPSDPDDVPPNLQQWEGWALHKMEDRLCPAQYHQGEQYQF